MKIEYGFVVCILKLYLNRRQSEYSKANIIKFTMPEPIFIFLFKSSVHLFAYIAIDNEKQKEILKLSRQKI